MQGPAPVPPFHNKELYQGFLLSTLRGLRNGIVCGIRIRLPYIIQAVAYAVIFREKNLLNRVKFVLKQAISHGRNLGLFVFFYKSICWLCRNFAGIHNGIESWIAGFIGGFIAFGDSHGVSGSVNNQIVLYLFARGIEGSLRTFHKKGWLPDSLDVASPFGFRVLAGFSLALILYLTEYQPDMLKPGFMSTMTNLYHESNAGALMPPDLQRFSPAVGLVAFTLLASLINPEYSLENVLAKIK
eukprot:TRINITY_DN883_c0_g2_i1.p1 TRINITY_DN883_c0_g2~~TRINITY_DN883_c0_g2_i1.p1  ORF type:complete len:242 (+),score=45.61 TRINITY_DN883_c0_g2_i1:165-890(+)